MTSIQEIQNNTITLTKNDTSCEINIQCTEKRYEEGIDFFYIDYKCKPNEAHPFYNKRDLMEHAEGDIIAKNQMTEGLIQLLMMNNIDIIHHSHRIDNLENVKTISFQNRQVNTIKFISLFDSNDIWCNVTITCKEIIVNDDITIYYLEFANNEINKAHPFYRKSKLANYINGTVILKNVMTEGLVNLLMMSEDELAKNSGHVHPIQYASQLMLIVCLLNKANPSNYHAQLMKIITLLWD
jgi:hypothetical protein